MADSTPEMEEAEAALDRALVELCRLMDIDPDDVRSSLAESLERDTQRVRQWAVAGADPDVLIPRLLDALTDDEPCRVDHHGYCQEHGAQEVDGECANAVARRLLGPEVTGVAVDPRVSVAANAIGYEMFRHERPVSVGPGGIDQVSVTDEEAARCQAAARRVLDQLEAFGAG